MSLEERLGDMQLEERPVELSRVEAYAMKIPPYWPAYPQVCFVQVKAQFAVRGITSQHTMYHQIVGSLSTEDAMEIRGLLLQPLEDRPYEVLKRKLIEQTAVSEQRQLRELFTAEELGDRKLTQLLRRMQLLLGDKAGTTDGSTIKELFMQWLPQNVQMVLASVSESTPLEELATLADKIREVATPSIATVTVPSQATREIEQLRAENAMLQQQISALQAATGPRRCR